MDVSARVRGFLAAAVMGVALSAATALAAPAALHLVLPDENGKPVKLSDLKGKIVVLEWLNPDCPFVKRHYEAGTMKNLAQKYAGKAVWLGVNSTHFMTPQDNARFKEKWQLPYAVLFDGSGEAGKAFAATTTPYMVVINKEGEIVYKGAIDDDPYGEKGEQALNYVEQALDQLLAGSQVALAEAKPYGCSVKYKS